MKYTTDSGKTVDVAHVDGYPFAAVGLGSGTVWARFKDELDAKKYQGTGHRAVEILNTTPVRIPDDVDYIMRRDGTKTHFYRRTGLGWVKETGVRMTEAYVVQECTGYSVTYLASTKTTIL